MKFKDIQEATEHTKNEIIAAIIQKVDQLDLKSNLISKEPLIVNYQGHEYEIVFETFVDGYLMKTYTKDRRFTHLAMIMGQHVHGNDYNVRIFMSPNFVPENSVDADEPSSYNYSPQRFMSEFITRLMQKNLFYNTD